MKGTLFLVPNSLGHPDPDTFLPPSVSSDVVHLRYFIVENVRNARRFLKSISKEVNIDEIHFSELNKHTAKDEIESFLDPLLDGNNVGLLSEAGLPGIADPGAAVVQIAHHKGIRVVPYTGPSSITLALMASGLNGQSFRFCGYLPVKSSERIKALKQLEQRVQQFHESQLFIETPYRNNALIEDILNSCKSETMLCIAADLTKDEEYVKTSSVKAWKQKKPDLHKRPAIFILGSNSLQ